MTLTVTRGAIDNMLKVIYHYLPRHPSGLAAATIASPPAFLMQAVFDLRRLTRDSITLEDTFLSASLEDLEDSGRKSLSVSGLFHLVLMSPA